MLGFGPIASLSIASVPQGPIAWGMQAAAGTFEILDRSAVVGPTGGYLGRQGWLAYQDFLGTSAGSQMTSGVEIRIGMPDGAAGVIWGGWQTFEPGNFYGQFVDWRVWWKSPSVSILGSLVDFTATCSVPPRIDYYQNVAVVSSGTTIVFTPANAAVPCPFNKGPCSAQYPNGAPLPLYQITWNNQPGDELLVTALGLSSMTIQILNGGEGVARTLPCVEVKGF